MKIIVSCSPNSVLFLQSVYKINVLLHYVKTEIMVIIKVRQLHLLNVTAVKHKDKIQCFFRDLMHSYLFVF